MITIVLTYRNRDLQVVKNCLDSLSAQSVKDFRVILVDYGSEESFANKLTALVANYTFIKHIYCPVQGQLWNKSRAINIALRQTTTPYFLVGDIDLIFKEDFVEKTIELAKENKVTYFKVGFLSKEESLPLKQFENYKIKHLSGIEATGITLFPAEMIKNINGYDEFYHGWGAEDSDVHIRLLNVGYEVIFYDLALYLLHQWHPKAYRSKISTAPFHSEQEKINHFYMQLAKSNVRQKANLDGVWGKMPLEADYEKLLQKPNHLIEIDSANFKVEALIAQLKKFNNELIGIAIKNVAKKLKIKQQLKMILGKKHIQYMAMEAINNRLLEEIITNYRNLPYHYTFNRQKKEINLSIQF